MKLIINDGRIAATATDDYNGPNFWVHAPADFDPDLIDDYEYRDGAVVLGVPQSVTMRQARLALLSIGKLHDVDTAIDSLPEPDRSAASIEWEYSQEVQRHNGFVAVLAPALGLTESDLDDLFRTAATL